MPSSIPYNPSLVLGNIVDPGLLATLQEISACQAVIESARDKLNSFIALKRSIDMSVEELVNMNVDTTMLINKSGEISKSIVSSATEYANIRVEQEEKIQQLKANMQLVNAGKESPIDYDKSLIKELPLAADSMTMDVQYFSFNENEKNAQTMAGIKAFINASTDALGDAVSDKISNAATTQVSRQREKHQVSGTLIITATCTHRYAKVFSPLVLDIDKAIGVWNELFPKEDRLPVEDPSGMQQVAQQAGNGQKSIGLLSGTTYGSSFVGMVHLLKKESFKTLPPEVMNSIEEQLTVGKWYARESGGFGLDPSFSADIKNMLGNQNITAHITVVTMGVVPSIKSNEVRIGVKTFADSDNTDMIEEVATVTTATEEIKTVTSSAAAAQKGAEVLAIKSATVQNMMLGLRRIDEENNKVLDLNSMMTAFDNYITTVNTGKAGVPINYYLKHINKSELARLWLNRYYPPDNKTKDEPSTEKPDQ